MDEAMQATRLLLSSLRTEDEHAETHISNEQDFRCFSRGLARCSRHQATAAGHTVQVAGGNTMLRPEIVKEHIIAASPVQGTEIRRHGHWLQKFFHEPHGCLP